MTEEEKPTKCEYFDGIFCIVKENHLCAAYFNWKKCDTHKKAFTGIDPGVIIIGKVYFHDINSVRIKRGAIIYPGVKIGSNVTIGHYCIIYPNSVLVDDISIPDYARVSQWADGVTILEKNNEFQPIHKP